MKKTVIYFTISFFIFAGLFSCSPTANTDSDETIVTEEVDQTPIVDEAAVDSVSNNPSKIESELDDILDGLE
jgi:hypothetical protein